MYKYRKLFIVIFLLFPVLAGCDLLQPVDSIGDPWLTEYQRSLGNEIGRDYLNIFWAINQACSLQQVQSDDGGDWHRLDFCFNDVVDKVSVCSISGQYRITQQGTQNIIECVLTANLDTTYGTINYCETIEVSDGIVSSSVSGSFCCITSDNGQLSCSAMRLHARSGVEQTNYADMEGALRLIYKDKKGKTYSTVFDHTGRKFQPSLKLNFSAEAKYYENDIRIGKIQVKYKNYWGPIDDISLDVIDNFFYNWS